MGASALAEHSRDGDGYEDAPLCENEKRTAEEHTELAHRVKMLKLNKNVQVELCQSEASLTALRAAEIAINNLPSCKALARSKKVGGRIGVMKRLVCMFYGESGFKHNAGAGGRYQGMVQLQGNTHRKRMEKVRAILQSKGFKGMARATKTHPILNPVTGADLYCEFRNKASSDTSNSMYLQYQSLRDEKYTKCMAK